MIRPGGGLAKLRKLRYTCGDWPCEAYFQSNKEKNMRKIWLWGLCLALLFVFIPPVVGAQFAPAGGVEIGQAILDTVQVNPDLEAAGETFPFFGEPVALTPFIDNLKEMVAGHESQERPFVLPHVSIKEVGAVRGGLA